MIDLHIHILPGLDDGPRTWESALEMARIAVADGVTTVVATPHLFARRTVELDRLNPPERILAKVAEFQERLAEAGIPLRVAAGCEVPLCHEMISLLEAGQVLTLNGQKRYLCLEMPEMAIPPAAEEICFHLTSQGITPIITHPERNPVFWESPEKLIRLLELGCLAQLTAASLTGDFGWRISRFGKKLVKNGLAHVVASDAHDRSHRPPILSAAFKKLRRWLGEARAMEMVQGRPAKILAGEPWD